MKFVSPSNLETFASGFYDKFNSEINDKLDGKSFKYLTQAEYDQLSDEEKNRNDIAYQITDKQISYNELIDKPVIPDIVVLTQLEYDALEASENINPNTYYLISDEN